MMWGYVVGELCECDGLWGWLHAEIATFWLSFGEPCYASWRASTAAAYTISIE